MKVGFISAFAISLVLMLVPPALANKHNGKITGGKITGVYCAQGPDNVHYPASTIKASIRNQLRKGQKFKFNYPGFGPISCTAY